MAPVNPRAGSGVSVDLSIVVPLYNEEENVGLLYEAISRVVGELEIDVEIIFVDDGSSDATARVASELARKHSRLRLIKFRRNYGQMPAMAAGIDHARGAIIVTMDGDLQNDPGDIPLFLDEINRGYDIVVGWRYPRQDRLITRRIPSYIANWLIGKITGVPIKDNGCSLKAYRASLIRQIPLYSELHRFIPAMASISGARISEIKVRHHARRFGVSKYGLSRIYKVLLDLLMVKTVTSFASRPLRWFSILAVLPGVAGLLVFSSSLHAMLVRGENLSVSVAGTGLLLIALASFLVLEGLLCELIHRTGNLDLVRLSFLTAGGIDRPRPEPGR